MSYTFRYDGKNDKFEIDYTGVANIQEVLVSGSAMKEIAGTKEIGVKLQNDIGRALAEYLSQNSISSPKEAPAFVLLEADMGVVENAVPVTPELTEICKKYISESTT